jgi:hypothetical protein
MKTFAAVCLIEFRKNYPDEHQNLRTENSIEYGGPPKFVDYQYLANIAVVNDSSLAWPCGLAAGGCAGPKLLDLLAADHKR